jgi:hypothetical protein
LPLHWYFQRRRRSPKLRVLAVLLQRRVALVPVRPLALAVPQLQQLALVQPQLALVQLQRVLRLAVFRQLPLGSVLRLLPLALALRPRTRAVAALRRRPRRPVLSKLV